MNRKQSIAFVITIVIAVALIIGIAIAYESKRIVNFNACADWLNAHKNVDTVIVDEPCSTLYTGYVNLFIIVLVIDLLIGFAATMQLDSSSFIK